MILIYTMIEFIEEDKEQEYDKNLKIFNSTSII